MIDIHIVQENVHTLSKKLDSLNIDSIFIEQDNTLNMNLMKIKWCEFIIKKYDLKIMNS